MSISNPISNQENPLDAYVKFEGTTGKLVWQSKTGVKELLSPKDISFIVLDDSVGVISGFKKDPISSNKIRSTDKEPLLNVFIGKSLLASGKWQDIKDKVKAAGGNYTKLIYCYVPQRQSLVEFRVSKGKLLKWMEFLKELNLKEAGGVGFNIDKLSEKTTGNTNYWDFEFVGRLATVPAIIEKCKELDIILQPYIKTITENGKN